MSSINLASRSEAPRPKLASSEVASSEANSVVSSEAASLEVPAEVAHSASAVATVSRSKWLVHVLKYHQ